MKGGFKVAREGLFFNYSLPHYSLPQKRLITATPTILGESKKNPRVVTGRTARRTGMG
jgi:hypothetical protein